MKKRITALLLCLVMVFSLIPTTVWAAAAMSVPLKLTVSSYGAPFINGNTGEHTVSSIQAYRNIDKSAVGSDNASGSATARFTGSNESGWTLVIDVVVGNYTETWTTNARVTNKDMSEATGSITFGLSFNTSGGTSTYIHIDGAKNLPVPPPDFDEIFNNETVRVTDLNTTNGHGTKTYSLMTGRYTSVSVNDSDTQYTITVKGDDYIKDYQNAFSGVTHTTVDGSNKTITLNYKNNKWVATPSYVTFTVECEAEEEPAKPTDEKIKEALEGKHFRINDTTNRHSDGFPEITASDLDDATFFYEPSASELQLKYPEKNITSNPYIDSTGTPTYVLQVNGADKLQSYIDGYNAAKGVEHEYNYHDYTFLKKNVDGTWYVSGYSPPLT